MGPVIEVPEEIAIKATQDSLRFIPGGGAGGDAFAARTRIIDRIDPSYRS
jgi:hypothetical protein